MQFRDQPLISIFELVSNITGLNFTFDRDVQANAPTTIYANKTPVRQVLTMVLQGKTRTLANPSIRVRNREKAKVLIGDRLPVVTTTLSSNFSSESINYQDVGLTLEVAPVIVNSDEVQVKLHMEVSNVTDTITTSTGLVAYQIGTRTAETVMSVRNNETQMLAGLLQRNERAADSGLPGLSRIPLLDRIFGDRTNNDTQTELVLLLTPRIVRNQAMPAGNVVQFDSGTETRITTARDPVAGSTPPSLPAPPPPAIEALPPPSPPPGVLLDEPPRIQP